MNADRRIALSAALATAVAAALVCAPAAADPPAPSPPPDIPVFTVVVDRAPLRIDVAANIAEISASIRAKLAEQEKKRTGRDIEVARADPRAGGG
jgi:Flp pilus assembly protein CpaB